MIPLAQRFADEGLDWIVPEWPAPANVHAFVTTRNGGVSGGARASLDVGPADLAALDGGTREAIVENRRRVALHLPAAPVWLEQVHGREVAVIDRSNVAASTAEPPVADAAVTRLANVPLAVRVADCLPVMLADDAGSVVAVAHAGWRGLAAGVLEAVLEAMDVPAANAIAWIGPGIGRDAFEVGDDVREAFVLRASGDGVHFRPQVPGKWLAGLSALAQARLARAGVARIVAIDACTWSDAARFHSHRRDRTPARLGAFAWRSGA